jgi:hypothetical protein
MYYAFNGADSDSNLKVDLEPKPNSVQTLSFDIVKFQDELTTASTKLKIPTKPVVLGAWARAVSERGEDGGTNTGVIAMEVSESINQAVILDSGNVQYESEWYVK